MWSSTSWRCSSAGWSCEGDPRTSDHVASPGASPAATSPDRAELIAALHVPDRPVPGRRVRLARSGRSRASSPHRPGAARPSWPNTASPWLAPRDGGRSTPRRSRRCRTRSTAIWSSIHGDDAVGLLTGDNAINGDAPIVVMTTEVLRNMIYGRSRALHDLGLVVLDEVHFLQDAYRGPVWEEVIIHLPPQVRLVCLSATVSNVAELADWITTVRGSTTAIVEGQRPVRAEERIPGGDLTRERLQLLPVFVDGRPNRDALQLDEAAGRASAGAVAGDGRSGRRPPRRAARPRRNRRTPRSAPHAPCDLLHLQPRPVRCRGEGLPRRRLASHVRRGAKRDPAHHRRGPPRQSRVGRSRRARLRTVRRPARHRCGRAPRRHGAADEGGRRGVLHRGPREGRVRDRDPGGRDQHARPFGRDRETDQVHRRAPSAADAR